MEKRIGITIILMVAVIVGGIAYASFPLSPQNTAGQATSVAFQNNGNSWKHVVAAFDITNIDGSIKSIYADLWIKPQGTANVDLSSLAGVLPEGTKIQVQTYSTPVPANQVPEGTTENKVTTTADPAQGGQFLAAITPSVSAADPVVSTPRQTVIANTITAIFRDGQFITGANPAAPVCAVAGGVSATAPTTGTATASTPRISAVAPLTGPVVAATPRLRIVLPL